MPKDDNNNHTVKLDAPLDERVRRAMRASGTKVWADFCRSALLERCRKIEAELRAVSPEDYRKIYDKGH